MGARHLKDKWEKLQWSYFKEKKELNVSGDNEGSKWMWSNMLVAMLRIQKKTGVPKAIDQGAPVVKTSAAPVEVDDDKPEENTRLPT